MKERDIVIPARDEIRIGSRESYLCIEQYDPSSSEPASILIPWGDVARFVDYVRKLAHPWLPDEKGA